MTTAAVQRNQLAFLHGAPEPVLTRWLYLPDDPFTVTLGISTPKRHWVEWALARDLLVDGLSGFAGLGDVRLWPRGQVGSGVLVVELRSPEGHALLELDLEPVQRFVRATTGAVPFGTESSMLDLDSEIAELTRSRAD